MNEKRLQEYARLIVRKGISIFPGQEVMIRSAVEHADFAAMVAEECYLAGASAVRVDWRDDRLTGLNIKYQTPEMLGRVEKWEEEKLKRRCEVLPADIYLDGDDPDAFDGCDLDKYAEARRAKFKITAPYRDEIENKYQWCVAAVAGRKWAEKVFPESADPVNELWEAIFSCSRVPEEGSAEAEWDRHNDFLHSRCDWLNSLGLRRLRYHSEMTGTDFEVGLMPQMRFMGGSEQLETLAGREHGTLFNANIPSEEIFTTPMKGDAEGTVYATRPLSYNGVLIKNFSIRFHNGRVAEVHAEENEDALKLMTEMDDGASMLGECALVPYHSPISESGILFYNTLLDENAACHLALGLGYSSCLENAGSYTQEQARELGVNYSMIHEDFMIGSPDLSIIGITESGEEIQIFRDGDWA